MTVMFFQRVWFQLLVQRSPGKAYRGRKGSPRSVWCLVIGVSLFTEFTIMANEMQYLVVEIAVKEGHYDEFIAAVKEFGTFR